MHQSRTIESATVPPCARFQRAQLTPSQIPFGRRNQDATDSCHSSHRFLTRDFRKFNPDRPNRVQKEIAAVTQLDENRRLTSLCISLKIRRFSVQRTRKQGSRLIGCPGRIVFRHCSRNVGISILPKPPPPQAKFRIRRCRSDCRAGSREFLSVSRPTGAGITELAYLGTSHERANRRL